MNIYIYIYIYTFCINYLLSYFFSYLQNQNISHVYQNVEFIWTRVVMKLLITIAQQYIYTWGASLISLG